VRPNIGDKKTFVGGKIRPSTKMEKRSGGGKSTKTATEEKKKKHYPHTRLGQKMPVWDTATKEYGLPAFNL